jgi:hypothetical protein
VTDLLWTLVAGIVIGLTAGALLAWAVAHVTKQALNRANATINQLRASIMEPRPLSPVQERKLETIRRTVAQLQAEAMDDDTEVSVIPPVTIQLR